MNISNLTDEEKIKLAFELFESVNDMITRLWRVAFGIGHRANLTKMLYQQTERLIKEYGYDNVRAAFEKAVNQDVRTLAYVNGILIHEREMGHAKKEIDTAKKLDSTPVTAEVAQSTAEIIKQFRIETFGNKVNKYTERQLTKVEYIKDVGADNFTESGWRKYKQEFE